MSGRRGPALQGLSAGRAERRHPQQDGQGDIHQVRRIGLQFSLRGELQVPRGSPQVDGGADVFAAVDAVPGGPHDLGHVGPHGVESRPAERSRVPCAGHGDLAGFRLLPELGDDVGRPVGIPERLEFRVQGLVDELVGAALNAPQAVHALIVDGIHHLSRIQTPMVVDLVHAPLFHAHGALQAPLFPGNDARLGDGLEPGPHGPGVDHVFCWHVNFLPLTCPAQMHGLIPDIESAHGARKTARTIFSSLLLFLRLEPCALRPIHSGLGRSPALSAISPTTSSHSMAMM